MNAPTSLQDLRRRQAEEARAPRPPSRPQTAPLPSGDSNSRSASLSEQLFLKRTNSQVQPAANENSIAFAPSAFTAAAPSGGASAVVPAPLPKHFQSVRPMYAQDVRAQSFADAARAPHGDDGGGAPATGATDFSAFTSRLASTSSSSSSSSSSSMAAALSRSLSAALVASSSSSSSSSSTSTSAALLARSLSYRLPSAQQVHNQQLMRAESPAMLHAAATSSSSSSSSSTTVAPGVHCGAPTGEFTALPFDWALKSRARFFSATPFDALLAPVTSASAATVQARAMRVAHRRMCAHSVFEPDDASSASIGSDSDALLEALHYFIFPPDAAQFFERGTAAAVAAPPNAAAAAAANGNTSSAIVTSTSAAGAAASAAAAAAQLNASGAVTAAAAPFVLPPALSQLALSAAAKTSAAAAAAASAAASGLASLPSAAANASSSSRAAHHPLSDLELYACAVIEQRWAHFDAALASLHSAFRAGCAPHYYVHWHKLAVVVRFVRVPVRATATSARTTAVWPCAMLAGVDARLRGVLMAAGVHVHAPFAALATASTPAASVYSFASTTGQAWDPERAADFRLGAGRALTMDALASRLERGAAPPQQLVIEQRIRELSVAEREHASLLLCSGAAAVQHLIDTLRACLRTASALSNDEPPVLVARTPFAHAAAECVRIVSHAPAGIGGGSGSSGSGSGNGAAHTQDAVYSFELCGPLLPCAMRDVAAVVVRATRAATEAGVRSRAASAVDMLGERSNGGASGGEARVSPPMTSAFAASSTGAVRMHAQLPAEPAAAGGLNLLNAIAVVSAHAILNRVEDDDDRGDRDHQGDGARPSKRSKEASSSSSARSWHGDDTAADEPFLYPPLVAAARVALAAATGTAAVDAVPRVTLAPAKAAALHTMAVRRATLHASGACSVSG